MGACMKVPRRERFYENIVNTAQSSRSTLLPNSEPLLMVARLHVDIILSIFGTWLQMKDVGRVDSACCSHSWRPWFLSSIHNQSFQIECSLFKDSVIASYIKWATTRQILTCCGTVLGSAQESDEVPSNALQFVIDIVLTAGDNMYSTSVGCGALCYLSATFKTSQEFSAPIKKKLIDLMHTACPSVQMFVLCIVFNIMVSNRVQIDELMKYGVMPALEVIWNHRNSAIARNAITAYSIVTFGSQEHIKAVFEVPRVVRHLLWLINDGANSFSLMEKDCAVCALCNIATRGTPEQVHYLLENNVVAVLCPLLNHSFLRLVYGALYTLSTLLQRIASEEVPPHRTSEIVAQVHKCGGICAIRELCSNESDNINISIVATSLIHDNFLEL